MPRFNKNVILDNTGTIENHAGGLAYSQSDEMQLVSVLLNSFFSDRYYYDNEDELKRLQNLIKILDPEFVSKVALYARREFGLRTISHIVAGELVTYLSGKEWAKTFYTQIVSRPDDMFEILAYIQKNSVTDKNPKLRVPNAVRKGFKAYIEGMGKYLLTKYKKKNSTISLKDVIYLVRPKRTPLLTDFVNERLKAETWESELTKIGQLKQDEDQKKIMLEKVWRDLVVGDKLPHMALLRNLRNIISQADNITLGLVTEKLSNAFIVKKSKVLPFRYFIAYKILRSQTADAYKVSKVLSSLSLAMQHSISNIKSLDGENLVVIDHSASMTCGLSEKSIATMRDIGDVMGGALVKKIGADVMVFGDRAGYVSINPLSLLVDIIFHIGHQNYGHGTDFRAIFDGLRKKYDRIFIFSDMEGWVGYNSPLENYKRYKKNYQADPYVYLFDLEGGGTTQIVGDKVIQISGFSEKVFNMIEVYEQDPDILLNTIKDYKVPERKYY